MSAIKWMDRESFWALMESTIPKLRIDYAKMFYFEINLAALQSKIGPIQPNQDLRGEDDPPGPVRRWYGKAAGIPVLLDHHYENFAVVHFAVMPSATETVRNCFKEWGTNWQEHLNSRFS